MKYRSIGRRLWDERWSYLFLVPMLTLFTLFTLRSIYFSFFISTYRWSGVGDPTQFIGLENFVRVARDPLFWNAFKNTLTMVLAVTPGQLILGLVFALILNRKFRGADVYRTLYFLPVVTTAAIVGLIMPLIFSPLSGPVNVVFMRLGLISQPLDWLGSPDTALTTVIIVMIWKWTGTYIVYWLAGLQTIPDELYEAAQVEGANGRQQLFRITLPLLKPIAAVIILLCVVGNLKPFNLIKTMTDGGPYFATDVVMTYIYRYAFSAEQGIPRLGLASAAGIFYGLVVIAITGVQGLMVRRVNAARKDASVQSRTQGIRVATGVAGTR